MPSLVQPAGGDQSLYAYIGQRIASGDIPYRDAWDQKPPAIHYTYALMLALAPYPLAIPLADLVVTIAIAVLLLRLGRRWTPSPGAGQAAALTYLLLANPVYSRFGGLWIRAQCETFIALALTLIVVTIAPANSPHDSRSRLHWRMLAAGVLLSIAFLFKYNTIVYVLVPLTALLVRAPEPRAARALGARLAMLGLGFLLPAAAAGTYFAVSGTGRDLYDATITYNLAYSGETYDGVLSFVRYLVTFPVWFSRLDSLWMLGGLGTAVLLALVPARPALLVLPIWVAASCLSIAVNGSRSLPQYFIQAQPALALTVGVAGAESWRRLRPWSRAVVMALLIVAVWRVTSFPAALDATRYDWRHMIGRQDRREYLERYGGRPGDKYSAAAERELASFIAERTRPSDRIFIFGFSGGVYVATGRASASRFFWSRPVIVEFNGSQPGYGAAGMMAELVRHPPRVLVLQRRDWDPDGPDSYAYFMSRPDLVAWLDAGYQWTTRIRNYEIWEPRSGT